MSDKKSQLTFLVSLCDASGLQNEVSQRYSQGPESLPYFCTRNNIHSAVAYLSQELMGMGLNCNFIDSGSQKVNLVAVINACWEVMHLYQTSVRDTNSLIDQRSRYASDLSHCQNTLRDLRETVAEKERLVCDAQERERQAATISKNLNAKFKTEKDEVRRLNSVLQQRETHHEHELRKKETENNRLRERLRRLVPGERQCEARPVNISLSNTLTRSNRSRAKWKTEATGIRHEEDLHQKVISQYETWVGQLSDENDQLKSYLASITTQISKLVTKYAHKENNVTSDGEMNSSMFSCDSLENPLFNLEFPSVREQVQQTLEDHLKVIVQLLEDKSNRAIVEGKECVILKKEVEDLHIQLAARTECLTSTNTSKEKGKNDVRFLENSYFVEELAVLEKKKEQLETEKKSLHEERENFTNAAVRLNKDKAAFEAEKVEFLKRQFLKELPPTLSSADVVSANESAGSLSSESLGEFFSISPLKSFAVPTITPPRGNINCTKMSTPIVLGPTGLHKQQRDMYSDSASRNHLCRYKSAPVSRASSIPRQDESEEGEASALPPCSSRSSTLERRRKAKSAVASARYRSQSQNRLDLLKDSGLLHSTVNYSFEPGQADGELLVSKDSENLAQTPSPYKPGPENLAYFADGYRDDFINFRLANSPSSAKKRLTVPQASSDGKSFQNMFYGNDSVAGETSKLKSLEADLLNLITKIGQQHGEAVGSLNDNPSAYEDSNARKLRRPPVKSLTSAPSSLSSSRRSSQDFSARDDQKENMHKQLIRK
ncbi:hypothetical protein SK128_015195 [Halocaridina rubra]|uniref:Afadin-and alpha-actinin-binding protein n=1 Tax=Halocaridina rubra TaxID=373956 RepID=A0AAN8XRW6_HALRR